MSLDDVACLANHRKLAGVGIHDEADHAHVGRHDGVVRHHVDALAHGFLGVAEAGQPLAVTEEIKYWARWVMEQTQCDGFRLD